MNKVARLPGVVLATLLLAGLGAFAIAPLTPGPAAAQTIQRADDASATPGDVSTAAVNAILNGKAIQVSSGPAPPNQVQANCTFTVLPQDNSTSGNERAPTLRNRFGRSIYLIKATELASAGLVSGASVTGIGWDYQTGQGVTGSTPLIIYLQNTSDVTNTKSTRSEERRVGKECRSR